MKKITFYTGINEKCTEIFYSTKEEPIKVINYTDEPLLKAFGVKENITWEDLEKFLESRCFPKERANAKELLRLLDIDFYNPELIVKKTNGRMCEDDEWLTIEEISDNF